MPFHLLSSSADASRVGLPRLCGFPPFYDENNSVLFAQIKAGAFDFPSPYWDDISDEAKDLILKLLVVDPTHRLSAAQVLDHPWVASVSVLVECRVCAAAARLTILPCAPLSLFALCFQAVPKTGELTSAKSQMKRFNARRRFRVRWCLCSAGLYLLAHPMCVLCLPGARACGAGHQRVPKVWQAEPGRADSGSSRRGHRGD